VTVKNGRLYAADGKPLDTTGATTIFAPAGGKAIYVMDAWGDMYVSMEHQFGVIHHSSFFAGGDVAAAGQVKVRNGELLYIDRQSGHYAPPVSFRAQVEKELAERGINMSSVDIQDYEP
jgi:hypothetical protein